MRRVLSTYLFVEHRLTVALLDRILRSGVDEIEIFCARQHIDYHNRAQIEELRHWFRDAELKVHLIHALLGPQWPQRPHLGDGNVQGETHHRHR